MQSKHLCESTARIFVTLPGLSHSSHACAPHSQGTHLCKTDLRTQVCLWTMSTPLYTHYCGHVCETFLETEIEWQCMSNKTCINQQNSRKIGCEVISLRDVVVPGSGEVGLCGSVL